MTAENIILSITGVVAIISLYYNYKQSRNKTILHYYDKTQEIRKETDAIDQDDKNCSEKANSLIKKSTNLYNVLSYSILHNVVNEKDAFNILKKNVENFRNLCLKSKEISVKDYEYLDNLYKRWDLWGVSRYYLNLAIKVILLLIVILIITYFSI